MTEQDSVSGGGAFRGGLVVAALAVLVAVGAGVYIARDRLPDLPFLSRTPPAAAGEAAGPAPDDPRGAHGELPDLVTPGAPLEPVRVPVTVDARRQQLIGVRLATVERTPITATVRAAGNVRYDETRIADVNLKVEGWIRELHVDFTGQFVAQGQPLFRLYSPDLLATAEEYLLALRTRDQVRESQVADAREYAERLIESARRRLDLWDVPAEELQAMEGTREPPAELTFRSPVAGYVIEKAALEGMHVAPGQTLYRVADLSRVWVEADVYERELPRIRVGATAVVTLDALPGERFPGRVVYVYPYVEEATRTVRVRLDLANPRGRLKPGMFAHVELSGPGSAGLTVPADAVLDSGTRQVVFVALGDGYFEPRDVTVGRRAGDRIEVLTNLAEGDRVATGATFFLDSESQLRGALQGYSAPPPPEAAGPPRPALEIDFRTSPDPPRAGGTDIVVRVTEAGGGAVADAEVTVGFFMPAMPSMNMPAMRSEATLAPAGDGVYRGRGEILMPGRWDVTVTVTRDGRRLGGRELGVVAR
ncbi:MAG: efflux RND transporter periplasmic adaptor subunit [Acidimicrobiia bacterium]|nr:efflux RND transporter periplasmic adaptor subunit [Acidimicrobiia bacterium]